MINESLDLGEVRGFKSRLPLIKSTKNKNQLTSRTNDINEEKEEIISNEN